MTQLKDLSLNLSEEDYHDYPAWSYSKIARYARDGFAALKTLHDRTEPTPSMEFGSLVDALITSPERAAQYSVMYREVPPAEKKVLNRLAQSGVERLDDVPDSSFAIATEDCQYYPKWGLDTRIRHLKEYGDYYETVASGKTPVSETDWLDATDMAYAVTTDAYLRTLFGKTDGDVEYLYQTQFLTQHTLPSGKTVPVKIMPDVIRIDHRKKTVQPIDLKTSSQPGYNFKESFLKFRYDIQASLYSDVLQEVMTANGCCDGYEMLPYLFVDISRTDKVPVTYRYDQTDFTQSDGLSFSSNGRTYSYKGWRTLLDEILYYESTSATVPLGMKTDGPNDLLEILNSQQQ